MNDERYFDIDLHDPISVRNAGMNALKKELGTVGTVSFLRQFIGGHGDYTAEREHIFEGIVVEDLLAEIPDDERERDI